MAELLTVHDPREPVGDLSSHCSLGEGRSGATASIAQPSKTRSAGQLLVAGLASQDDCDDAEHGKAGHDPGGVG